MYTAFRRYNLVVDTLADLFLNNPSYYVEAEPTLPLACRRTFRTCRLYPACPRGAPYSRYHPY